VLEQNRPTLIKLQCDSVPDNIRGEACRGTEKRFCIMHGNTKEMDVQMAG
jgi:hypothetical protein